MVRLLILLFLLLPFISFGSVFANNTEESLNEEIEFSDPELNEALDTQLPNSEQAELPLDSTQENNSEVAPEIPPEPDILDEPLLESFEIDSEEDLSGVIVDDFEVDAEEIDPEPEEILDESSNALLLDEIPDDSHETPDVEEGEPSQNLNNPLEEDTEPIPVSPIEFDLPPEEVELIEPSLLEVTELPLILINEILADPLEKDAENEFIELYNPGLEPVDLSSWSLDDEKLDDNKSYTFDSVVIEPESYLLIMRPESKITLNNDEDAVYLFDSDGVEIDYYRYSKLKAGRSWGRDHSNEYEWTFYTIPSPNEENLSFNRPPVPVIDIQKDTKYLKLNVTGQNSSDPDGDSLTFLWDYGDGTLIERENPLIHEYLTSGEKTLTLTVTDEFGLSAAASISFSAEAKVSSSSFHSKNAEPPKIIYPHYELINEFMPSPHGKDNENEWVELYNSSSQAIDLSGWYLDDEEGASRPYKFPDQTIISPGTYLVFKAGELKLSLKNTSDVLRLLSPDKAEIERIAYDEVEDGWSFAKDESGDFKWSKTPTPGLENAFPKPPKAHVFGDVIFEAVLPNPAGPDAGNEQVLIKNMTDEQIDLNYWSFADLKSEKTLPSYFIEPFSSIALSSDNFRLNLNNSEEALALSDPYGTLIASIEWKKSSSGAWLFNPDSLLDDMKVEVDRVIDGDTIVVNHEDRLIKIRLIGVDTPETVHPFKPVEFYGRQASDYLKRRLENQFVSLRFEADKLDKYGRLLAYVYLDDSFVNEDIIRLGYGLAYTRFPFKFLEDFVQVESEAKEGLLGLWQNKKIPALIAAHAQEPETLDENLLFLEIEELEEELEEVLGDSQNKPLPSDETRLSASPIKFINCHSDDLKIDSLMPNAEKGFSMEYIRLKNTGDLPICLNGWSLDDVLEKGSKPFLIRDGGLKPGAVRTFRKLETKLSLNNSNDCVYLIDPSGEVQDHICYEKTHKNEIFTHEGGDWVPEARTKKVSSSKAKKPRHRFKRDSLSYQFKLFESTDEAQLIGFDVDDSKVYATLEDQDVSIAYRSESIDMEMVQLLSSGSSVIMNTRLNEDGENELLSLGARYLEDDSVGAYQTFPLNYFLFILLGLTLFFYLFIQFDSA